jgi:XTP/dITP diphosphohydrolase
MRDETAAALLRFNEVVERLRAPDGCPWDRRQTHATLAPYLLEETYEVLDAIAEDHIGDLREELGDILLQVFLHSAVAAERRGHEPDGFDLGDVAEAITAKMIHRHPHVFGDAVVDGADQVVVNWERLKAEEKSERRSLLEGVPRSLPALALAEAVQRRPARVGFDPLPSLNEATESIRGRLDRVVPPSPSTAAGTESGEAWTATEGGFARAGAVSSGDPLLQPSADAERLIGDLLFDAVALSRRLGVNPEAALRDCALRFAQRFGAIEAALVADGIDVHEVAPIEWERRWQAVNGGS